MKIALIGYGKMGQIIEELAVQRGHLIVFRGNSINQEWKSSSGKPDWDVAIEFTNPHAVVDNLKHLIQRNIPTVCGSTGWNKDYEYIEELVRLSETSFITASNFSVGVNLFFAMNRILARIMNHHEEYQVSIEEIHHTEKKDAPSGTAITAAEQIISNIQRLKKWKLSDLTHESSDLPISALRLPQVPGTHTVNYVSQIDTLSFTHTALSRKGFALGALLAAEYINGKKGIFTIQEVLNINID